MDHLGSDIKARRRALGLNQRELAELSGTSERFIRDLEHGKASVRLDKAMAVLTTLGLDFRAVARSR
jgi:HTH-type transcriptional regulator / antitoxin HipB